MAKIVFVGAGSSKFVREVVVDLVSFPELRRSHICLMDIDQERLERSEKIVRKIIGDLKIDARLEATTDQRRALDGANYVLITIMVGGFKHYKSDVAIPEKYGVTQAVSDTSGPGGVFRIVRTSPVLEKIVRDLRELSPQAWILNYANPMSMNCWTLDLCGHPRTVGLCHSIQGMYPQIAQWLNVPAAEIKYAAAGINHVNFYLKLEHGKENLYPRLAAAAERIIREYPAERVRFELLEYLGYYPAEGPYHQSEYYSWFRKNQAAADHYAVETYWGYKVDWEYYRHKTAQIERQIAGAEPIQYDRSLEYGARIIHAMESDEAEIFYGNVRNRGLIENLPAEAIVEVPCVADRNGIFPCRMGRIPTQLAAVMSPHIHLHELAVQGVLRKDRRMILQAIQTDPLTGTVLALPKIREMVNELFEENALYTRDWR